MNPGPQRASRWHRRQNDEVIAVISHAWTSDADSAADGYVSGIERFGEFHERQPGFRGRVLVRSQSDDTHFTNIRFFDDVSAYEAMIHVPGYADHINGLAEHLRPHEGAPGKDYADVVVHEWPDDPSGAAS